MARPKLYRDPIHGQLRFDNVDLTGKVPTNEPDRAASWVLRKLIECPEFQRLRHIRQNGLTNLVFHGAEHSRFTHSMGVSFLAGEMFQRITRNMDEPRDVLQYAATRCAALLHDVGHGPFSHTIEEILRELGIEFDHEHMTRRFMVEDGSVLQRVLLQFDPAFPQYVAAFIDKKLRPKKQQASEPAGTEKARRPPHDHWCYKLVSSQLDADRLDYLQRDATFAGIDGNRFDLHRLLDMLQHLDNTRIAVDRKAIQVVEGYLIALDQMYKSVYFHHTVRAASVLLSSTIRRAVKLHKNGDKTIFGATTNPLRLLVERGQTIDLADYARLGEFHVWTLIEEWSHHGDEALSTLSTRLLRRQLFKTIELNSLGHKEVMDLVDHARKLVQKAFPPLPADAIELFVTTDEPRRTSYKLYDWRAEGSDESIWLIGGDNRKPAPIDQENNSKIITALKETNHFTRLVFPGEIRDRLVNLLKKG